MGGENELTGAMQAEQARKAALRVLTVPKGYVPAGTDARTHDGRLIWHFRYEKSSGRNNGLGGEHYSFTVDALDGRLLGVSLMDSRFQPQDLPEKKEALKVAEEFLERVEPELVRSLAVLWVDRHDESVLVADGEAWQEALVSGSKVKMRREPEGDYAWVIVGRASDESSGNSTEVVTFERDVVWDSAKGHRATEFWLSDKYLAGDDYADAGKSSAATETEAL